MATVAVVGAGLAGLACARVLSAAGHGVRVFDKSRGVGGRLATRRGEAGTFDHGAQYFTARDPAFLGRVENWRSRGLAAEYAGRIASVKAGNTVPVAAREPRFVGVPGMNSIARMLADGLDVLRGRTVTGIAREGAVWTVCGGDDAHGGFDAVAVAVPAVQAVPLLAAAPALAARAAAARYAPCWAVLAGFDDLADPGFDAAFVSGSPLAWVMRDASKPGRAEGSRWVLHAGADWSSLNVEWEPSRVLEPLLAAFENLVGQKVKVRSAAAHRWRYALTSGLDEGCLWDGSQRIGAAGDWCTDGRVEGAWVSGTRLGREIAAALPGASAARAAASS